MGNCLHEANPAGGFGRWHKRLCDYAIDCFNDAVVHVQVIDTGWCGNTCRRCTERITGRHNHVEIDTQLRGLNTEDANDNQTENTAL